MTTRFPIHAAIIIASMVGLGCASRDDARPSNLTAGMAKKTIIKGQTKQAEVMEVFGPPDLITHRDDLQIWTYDKIRNDVQMSGGFLTVGVAGIGGAGARSSSTSTMLIIYFDSSDVVKDYRLNITRF